MTVQPLTPDNIATLSGWRRWQARFLALLPAVLRPQPHADGEEQDDSHGSAGLGALLSFGVRIASALVTFLAQIILARWLGAHDYGVYTYVWVVVNVAGVLATIGLSMSAVRFLNEYLEHRQPGLARGFLRFGRLATLLAGLLMAAFGIGLLAAVPGIIEDAYRTPLMLGLLALPAFAVMDFHEGVGRARGWLMLALAPPYLLRPLLLLVFVAIGVWLLNERDAVMAALALVAATWAAALLQFLPLQRRLRGEHGAAPCRMQRAQWLKVSLPLLLLDGFTLIMLNIDVLLLKLFVSPDQLAIYFAAARVISFVAFVHFAITAVAMPRFAAAYARRDHATAARLLRQFRLWTFAPSLLGALLLLAVGPFVLALFGPDFPAAMPVMAMLAAAHVVRSLAGPAEAMLSVSGRQVYIAVITGITAALNIVLNLALIPRHGLLGAAMATTGAYLFQTAILWIASNRLARDGYGEPPARESSHATNDAG